MTSIAFDTPGGVVAHMRSLVASLLPAERAVVEVMLRSPETAIEMSSQQVAEAAGASRATVVRTCQSLGFTGYQQFRVMLARDLGPLHGLAGDGARPNDKPDDGPDDGAHAAAHTPAAAVRACFSGVAESLPAMTALLADADLDHAVGTVAGARRLLVAGNGLSAPLAQLCAQRLVALGRPADAPTDGIAQQVAARHMSREDALVVISGSGANETTMRCALAARDAGASIVLVTAFGRSPLTAVADISLVVGMRDPTFRDELTVTTRIPQFILIEGLAAGVSRRLGEHAQSAHAATMAVVAENLAE
jgi:DNA-binding MurR/RpiR family transcriptional regulator